MPLRRERKIKLLAPLLGLPKSIYYKIVVTHQAEKNLDVRPYKVLLLTCVVNYIAGTPTLRLCPVVSALSSESDDPGSSPGRGKALCPRDVREKNANSALGLAKSIYYARTFH